MQEHKADAFAPVPRPERAERGPLAGELAFISPEAQVQRTAELLGEGAVVVDVPPPPASMRGKLAEYLDDKVERALGVRGAPSPYLAEWSASEGEALRLGDQLSRARRVGATGIAIALGSLDRIAAPALTPEDSATLRAYAQAARDEAVVLLVDDADLGIGGYGEPVELGLMLSVRRIVVEDHAPLPAHDRDQDEEADVDADEEADEEADVSIDLAVAVAVAVAVSEAAPHPATDTPPPLQLDLPEALVETNVDAPVVEKSVTRAAAERAATAGVPVAGPSDFWRSWAIALGAARGPQPLGAFERLFIESYMPLTNAIAEGLDDPRALRAHDEFCAGFERSYTDAFATFGASSRRRRRRGRRCTCPGGAGAAAAWRGARESETRSAAARDRRPGGCACV